MAEYIDRQKLIDDFQTAGSCFVYGDYIPAIVSRIKMQPAIEPKAMPVVQELQAQVKEQKERLAHLEYWELDRKQVFEICRRRPRGRKGDAKALRKDNRGAASGAETGHGRTGCGIEDIPKICKTCKYGKSPCDWCVYDPDGELNWEWRGPVAENATAESEPKPQRKKLAVLQPLDGVGSKEEAKKNHVPGTALERSNRNG